MNKKMLALVRPVSVGTKSEGNGGKYTFIKDMERMIGTVIEVTPMEKDTYHEGKCVTTEGYLSPEGFYFSRKWLMFVDPESYYGKDYNVKQLLKSGYIVETREGKLYVVILDSEPNGDIYVREGGWNLLSNYTDSLINKAGFSNLDIMRIYKHTNGFCFNVKDYKAVLVWERRE